MWWCFRLSHIHPESVILPRIVPELCALSKRLGLRRDGRLMELLCDELSKRALPQLDEDLFRTSRQRKSYGVQEVESSFQSRFKTYSIPNGHALTPHDFLADVTPIVRGLIIKHLKRLRGLKVNLLLLCDYKKGAEVQEL